MSQDLFSELVALLRKAGLEADDHGIADAIWLAQFQPPAATREAQPGEASLPGGEPRPSPTPDPAEPRSPAAPDPGPKAGPEPASANPRPASAPDSRIFPSVVDTDQKKQRASPVLLPGARALPASLEIARALRPFRRRLPSRHRRMLDEEATVEATALSGFVRPVLLPLPERWFDVALVVDGSRSMDVWRKTIDEFERLLSRQGAFGNVNRWRLTVSDDIVAVFSGTQRRQASALQDPRGRTLILIVTNGVAAFWDGDAVAQVLAEWSAHAPVAILQVFSQSRWSHTVIGSPTRQVRSILPGAAGRKLAMERARRERRGDGIEVLAVPILSLAAGSVARWARTVMASGGESNPAVVFTPGFAVLGDDNERGDERPLDPRARVEQFHSIASRESFRLACHLSVVPLALPIIRVVHQLVCRQPVIEDLGEVLASGLLERVTPDDPQVDPDEVLYDFSDGVRDVLLGSLPMESIVDIRARVQTALTQFIERQLDRSIDNFRAFVLDEHGKHELSATAKAFVEVERDLLQRLRRQTLPVAAAGKTRVLFMLANPRETPDLQLDSEVRAIETRLRASSQRDSLELITRRAMRPDDLLQAFNQHRPRIVHFSGRGSNRSEILVLDESGKPQAVSQAGLSRLFGTFSADVRVAVLNACFSKPQAEAIAAEIGCVIGIAQGIVDDAAITFLAALYHEILLGRSIKEAFELAIVAMHSEDWYESETPVLLTRPGLSAAEIYPLKPLEMAELAAQKPRRFQSNIPPRRGLPFLGRDAVLDEIVKIFDSPPTDNVVVLRGPPGVGKTELAHEFARRRRDSYPGGTFTLAGGAASVAVALARIGRTCLDLRFAPDVSIDDQALTTFHALGREPSLLILDDPLRWEAFERWLPHAGMSCHLVITTVRERWDRSWSMLVLEPLADSLSLELVEQLAGSDMALRHGAKLVKFANGLPVQLVPRCLTLSKDIERHGDAVIETLTDDAPNSFRGVYNRLAPEPRLLLHAAAWLNDQRIIMDELRRHMMEGAGWSPQDVSKHLAACLDVQVLQGDADLRMHQLFAAYIRETAPAADIAGPFSEIVKAQARRLLEIAREVGLAPNRIDLVATMMTYPVDLQDWKTVDAEFSLDAMMTIGRALQESGLLAAARPWLERAVATPLPRWAAGIIVTPGGVPVLKRQPMEWHQVVVIPVDATGGVRLNTELRSRLALPTAVTPSKSGFSVVTAELRSHEITRAFLETLAGPQAVRETIATNLRNLLGELSSRGRLRIWLPLFGREGGGLSREDSLELILDAIEQAGLHDRADMFFSISASSDIGDAELIGLRAMVERTANRPHHDVRGALREEGVAEPDDATVALFTRAAQLIFMQSPGRNNGRIQTHMMLLAMLETGRRQAPSSPAHRLVSAWEQLAPGTLDRLLTLELPRLQITPPETLGPVIFSRDSAEVLKDAIRKAGSAPLALPRIVNALLEQAGSADTERDLSVRRLLNTFDVDPVELREMFDATGRGQFVMERQQQTNWNWCATAVSIAKYFDAALKLDQCELANQVLGRTDCCVADGENLCNVSARLEDALAKTGNLQSMSARALSASELVERLDRNEIVPIRIAWRGGGSHFQVITGYDRSSNGDLFATIQDSLHGESIVRFDALPNAREFEWTHTFQVRSVSFDALMETGLALNDAGQFSAARPWFERAVAVAEKGVIQGQIDHVSLGRALHGVGYCLSRTGEFAAARSLYERAVAEAEKGDVRGRVDHESIARGLHEVGYCLSSAGEFAAARPWYERAVAEAEKGDVRGRADYASIGASLHEVGRCLISIGEFAAARSWFERAIVEWEKGDVHGRVDHDGVARSLRQIGISMVRTGEFSAARPWLDRAVAEAEKGDTQGRVDHESLGKSLHELGWCLSSAGELAAARPLFERAVAEKEKGNVHGHVDHESLSRSLREVGICLMRTGEFAAARPWFERAVAQGEKGDAFGRIDHESLGRSLHQVGYCLSNMGEFAAARSWFERAIVAWEKGDVHGRVDHEGVARSLRQIGISMARTGEFSAARPWFERAVAECEKGDVDGRVDHESFGRSLHEVGWCLSSLGEFASARPWFERAIEETEKGDFAGRVNHESLSRSLRQVGICLTRTGELEGARLWFERAVAEGEKGDAFGRIDHDSLGRSLHQVGYCLSNMGEFAAARSWFERAVAEKLKGDVYGRVDHESLGGSLHQIGYCLSRAREFAAAHPWFARAIEEKEKGDVYGRIDHESLRASRNALEANRKALAGEFDRTDQSDNGRDENLP